KRSGNYELATLVIEPAASAGGKEAAIELQFGTEEDKGVALLDDVELQRGQPAGPDLLVNGGFEGGSLAPWTTGTSGGVLEPGCGRAGRACVHLFKKGSLAQKITGLAPNTTYCASAWLKGAWFRFGARGGYKTDHISVNSPNDWVRRTI